MKFVGIIPARYASTRFPGKPLAMLGGKPVIQRVYEQVKDCFDDLYVATDDERIFDALIKARSSTEENDLSLISNAKEDLLININKRHLVTSGMSDFSAQISDLQAKKEQFYKVMAYVVNV